MIRKSIKGSAFFILVLSFILVSFFTGLFVRNRKRKLTYLSEISSFYSKMGLRVLGIKVNLKNYENLSKKDKNCLLVSNHLSYIDIFVVSSVVPSIFVASIDEMRRTFLLETIAKFGGSVFTERKIGANLPKEIEAVSDILKEGFNVVLFPEARTSNGDSVSPFKTAFFTSAIKSKVDIAPICLKYKTIDGQNLNSKNRDLVFYYGDMTFFRHFFGVLSLKSVDVELIELESIKLNPNPSRKELAKSAFDSISLAY